MQDILIKHISSFWRYLKLEKLEPTVIKLPSYLVGVEATTHGFYSCCTILFTTIINGKVFCFHRRPKQEEMGLYLHQESLDRLRKLI